MGKSKTLEMKPGDKVWVFTGEEIMAFIFDGYEISGAIFGHIDNHTRVLVDERRPIFPTREALCEHYRKIFE